jgi:hypothetical protein
MEDDYCVAKHASKDSFVICAKKDCGDTDGYKHAFSFKASKTAKDGLVPYSLGSYSESDWKRYGLWQVGNAEKAGWGHEMTFYASKVEGSGLKPLTRMEHKLSDKNVLKMVDGKAETCGSFTFPVTHGTPTSCTLPPLSEACCC